MKSLVRTLNLEGQSKLLLVSIVLFFVLAPFLEGHRIGEVCLIANLYLTLVVATLQLAAKRALFWSIVPIAASTVPLSNPTAARKGSTLPSTSLSMRAMAASTASR